MPMAPRPELAGRIDRLTRLAADFGLAPMPLQYEIVPDHLVPALAAYPHPSCYSHWSFGKAFWQLTQAVDAGMVHIFELMIHAHPCLVFLSAANSLLENTVVVAHALAHSDFMAHNRHFRRLPPPALAADQALLAHYQAAYGFPAVEEVVTAALALAPHAGQTEANRTTDLLFHLLQYGEMREWERDIVRMVYNMAMYLLPQRLTKIVNEGWACFWHRRLVRALDLSPGELLEFAHMQVRLLAPGQGAINPYQLGTALWQSAAGQSAGTLFALRDDADDVAFLQRFYSPQPDCPLDLPTLLRQVGNGAIPRIAVTDHNYRHGGLYLQHIYDGRELDLRHARKAVGYCARLWGRPVYLETELKGDTVVLMAG